MVQAVKDKLPEAPWTEVRELITALRETTTALKAQQLGLVLPKLPLQSPRADVINILASVGMPVSGLIPLDMGVATGGSPTTLQDNSKAWGSNIWPGSSLAMYIGGQKYSALISSNTSNTLTFPVLPSGIMVNQGVPYVISNANMSLSLDVPLSTRASEATLRTLGTEATSLAILAAIGGLVPSPNPSTGVAFTVTCVIPSHAYPVPAFAIPKGYAVMVQGHPKNTGMCYVSFDKVSVLDPTKSRTLVAGEDITLGVANTNAIWLSTDTANQIVSFIVEQT